MNAGERLTVSTFNKHPTAINVHVPNDGGNIVEPWNNAVFVNRDRFEEDDNSTLTHEMGHYFGLLHTHMFHNFHCFKEPVGRGLKWSPCPPSLSKRCVFTGDLLCDTEADPRMSTSGTYNGDPNCTWNANGTTDAWGDTYRPNPNNYMGYANSRFNCRTDFSYGQKQWMFVWAFRFRDAIQKGWLPSSNDRFDTFEPDNEAVAARPIFPGETQEHTFHRKNQNRVDVDWVSFTASPCSLLEPTIFQITEISNNPIDAVTFFERIDTTGVEAGQLTPIESNGTFTFPAGTLVPNEEYLIRITQDNDNSEYSIRFPLNTECVGGPSVVCNTPTTFSVAGRPAGSTITWDKSRNLTYVSGQNTNSYSVMSGSGSGNGWVRPTLRVDGVNFDLPQKDVLLGVPPQVAGMTYDLLITFPSEICVETRNQPGDFYAGLVTSRADYAEWETDAGAIVSFDPTPDFYNSISVRLTNYGPDRYIRTREVNACGAGPWLTHYFDLNYDINGCSGGGGIGGFARIYPNPTSQELIIEQVDSESDIKVKDKEKSKLPVRLEILDDNQKIVYEESCDKKKWSVDVSAWQKGIYYVRITKGEKMKVERLVVE